MPYALRTALALFLSLPSACGDGSKDSEIARLRAELAERDAPQQPGAQPAAVQPPPAAAPEPKITARQACEHMKSISPPKPDEPGVDILAECIAELEPVIDKPEIQRQARCLVSVKTLAERSLKCLGEHAVLHRFFGKGQQTVRPFKVDDKWEVWWNASGAFFSATLYSAEGEMLDVVANQQGDGTGSAFRPKGGEYYLTMNAMGSWTVEIRQLP